MDAFRDEVYEQMDDISKLIEPFEFKVNNELALFPDEVEIDEKVFYSLIVYSNHREYTWTSLSSIVRSIAEENKLSSIVSETFSDYNFANKMFKFKQVLDEGSEEIRFDLKARQMLGGKLFLVKRKTAFEDEDIKSKQVELIADISRGFHAKSMVNKKRVNELADLFGAKDVKSERASFAKLRRLKNHYVSMIQNNTLQIKDMELFKRFLQWNIKYIKDGSLPAMQNIATLRIMTRNGAPIYSMKEQDV